MSFPTLFFKDTYVKNLESKAEGIERITHSKEGIPQHFYILSYMQFFLLFMFCI